MLSVSGARGIVGATMTPVVAAEYAAAFGSYIRDTTGHRRPRLIVGRDSRLSGAILADAAVAGLRSVGCDVVRLGIVTTPSVAVMINTHSAAGGVVLTASHNPIQWNGMKCLNQDGVAPPVDEAQQIIDRFRRKDISWVGVHELGTSRFDDTTHVTHIGRVLAAIDPGPIRARKFKVVLDSVNGAGCVAGKLLLRELGCTVHHLNGEPTGDFAHTPEPIEENLTELAAAVAQQGADVGFAQDPDADRCAVIDEAGRYIGEEYTLALCAKRMLDVHGGAPMAANLSTSRMIDDIAAKYEGARVARTAVGEANVVDAMKQAGAIVGGEGNGGVIVPSVCWVRDSLSSMAIILGLMAAEDRELSRIVNELPRYAMVKHKVDLDQVGGRAAIDPMMDRVREAFADERIDDADGVRIDFEDGWVHLRPSNTEPIVRLIAEGRTDERAWEIIRTVAEVAGLPL
jgi:phosphomannomutase